MRSYTELVNHIAYKRWWRRMPDEELKRLYVDTLECVLRGKELGRDVSVFEKELNTYIIPEMQRRGVQLPSLALRKVEI